MADLEREIIEQEIDVQREAIKVGGGAGGAVDSVNGYTGDVVLKTSDLENDSGYQTGDQVDEKVSDAAEQLTDDLADEARLRAGADQALDGRIDDLNTAMAGKANTADLADVAKTLNDKIGDLTTLDTTDQSSVVVAINEIVTDVGNVETVLQTLNSGSGV